MKIGQRAIRSVNFRLRLCSLQCVSSNLDPINQQNIASADVQFDRLHRSDGLRAGKIVISLLRPSPQLLTRWRPYRAKISSLMLDDC